jgi:hypothetical protein
LYHLGGLEEREVEISEVEARCQAVLQGDLLEVEGAELRHPGKFGQLTAEIQKLETIS